MFSIIFNAVLAGIVYLRPFYGSIVLLWPTYTFHLVRAITLFQRRRKQEEYTGDVAVIITGDRKQETITSFVNQRRGRMKIYAVWDEGENINYDLEDCVHVRKHLWDGPDFRYRHVVIYTSNPVSRYCVSHMAKTLDEHPHADAIYGTKCVSPWNHTGSLLDVTIRAAFSYWSRFTTDTRIPFDYDGQVPVMTHEYVKTIPEPSDSVIVRDQFAHSYVRIDPLEVLPTDVYYDLLFKYPDAAFALWDFHTIPLFYFCTVFAIVLQDLVLTVPFFIWCVTHGVYLYMNRHLLYAFVLNIVVPIRLMSYLVKNING